MEPRLQFARARVRWSSGQSPTSGGGYAVRVEIDDLVLAVQGGDSRAWTELALRVAADLRPFFRRWFDEDEVKDLVQTTLMTVHRKLPQFEVRPGEPFLRWVRTIARIEAQEALRQRARARRLAAAAELAAAPPSPSPKVSWLDRSRLWGALRASLAKLSSRYRVVIENDLQEGDDVALARRHRIVPGTVRTRRRRAHQLLRRLLRRFARTPTPQES